MNKSSPSSDKAQVVTVEHDEGAEVISFGSSTSDISSLNPNGGDKGLKRTLKSRHLTVIQKKNLLFLQFYVNFTNF
jgi:amino acid permease